MAGISLVQPSNPLSAPDCTLEDRGYTDQEIVEARSDRTLIEAWGEFDVAPPSITANAVRQILKRLCEDAEIDVPGDADYLMPPELVGELERRL